MHTSKTGRNDDHGLISHQMEREAQADIDAGQMHRYANVEEAIAALERLEHAAD